MCSTTVPKDELQDVDQPQDEVHGVEETTHGAPTIRGRKCLTEAKRLVQDAKKVVGPPRDSHLIGTLDTWLL